MSTKKAQHLALVVTNLLVTSQLLADESQTTAQAIIKQVCFDCHNADNTEGDLNLARMPWSLDDVIVRKQWVKIHDRVAAGEMPPDKDDLPLYLLQRLCINGR